MGKKNSAITLLSNNANEAYVKIKNDIINMIQKLQQFYGLTDNDMQLLLGLNENDFSALMDERLHYVMRIDTLLKVNILNNSNEILLPKIDGDNIIEQYKDTKFNNSLQRLLDTIGVSTADEIDFFTDFLIDSINKQKKNVSE